MKDTSSSALPTFLILSSAENDENIAKNDDFIRNLNERLQGACQTEWHNYHDIGLEIGHGVLRAFIVAEDRPLTDFKAVYFKSYFRYHEQATSIAEALDEQGIPFVGTELRHYIPAYKLSQLARLSRAGIRIPHTVYLSLEHYVEHFEALQAKLGEQFVFKAIDGSTGKSNYLIRSKEQLAAIVARHSGDHFIAQAFIPNDSDLRVLIVGGQIELVIERSRANDDTHLNNTSQGATAQLIAKERLTQPLQAMSLQAAAVMDRDVAGVDLMLEHGTGVAYILEVNASPQIASGAFEAEKLAVYVDYFKQLLRTQKKTPGVVGRAERISFPKLGFTSVPARIDTGARTSAVWASNIRENNGTLEFSLFGKGSEFFTGATIRTADYSQREVVNSTGQSEQRYIVKLAVRVRGRTIAATFTLADRATQVYPVLIGRNVLHGKFIVDVRLGSSLTTFERPLETSEQATV